MAHFDGQGRIPTFFVSRLADGGHRHLQADE
jgi:hypothetical protein